MIYSDKGWERIYSDRGEDPELQRGGGGFTVTKGGGFTVRRCGREFTVTEGRGEDLQ